VIGEVSKLTGESASDVNVTRLIIAATEIILDRESDEHDIFE